jgi:hypothetical protein
MQYFNDEVKSFKIRNYLIKNSSQVSTTNSVQIYFVLIVMQSTLTQIIIKFWQKRFRINLTFTI